MAGESIQIEGRAPVLRCDGDPCVSGILTVSGPDASDAKGGDITIETPILLIRDSGNIFSDTRGAAPGGPTVGDATSVSIDLGSGGGSGSRYDQFHPGSSGAGGNGGASVTLLGAVDLYGSILVDGSDGTLGIRAHRWGTAAGGGGAGGGVLLSGDLTLDGSISATGGDGGDPETKNYSSSGGGAGGGRIKLFGCLATSIGQNFSTDVSGGNVGTDNGQVKATAGAAGSFFDDTTGPCNEPPVCSAAAASIETLWPPNHKFVAIDVLGVTDPDGDATTITVDSIFQDEPTDTFGDGKFTPDGQVVDTDTAEVRAERSGTKKVPGDGRVYHIGFTADDGNGAECSGTVTVCVPHDQGESSVCVDGGPLFDSTL